MCFDFNKQIQLFEHKRRIEEIELRLKSLEKENKDTQLNNAQLTADLAKARERENMLEKFMISTLSLFTQQNSSQYP